MNLMEEDNKITIVPYKKKYLQIYGLYKFFCEIDFNGDGHMQWEEFTQFIIDTVEGDNDAKVDEGDEDSKNKIFNEKQMIKYKRYHISNRIRFINKYIQRNQPRRNRKTSNDKRRTYIL